MKKVLFSILGVLSILLVSGCVQQQTVESSSPLPTQSEFSLSHGVSSIDILTEDLTFTGAPVHLTYEFETGNVDSNIGLLLFLNGDIQPFSVDDNYPSVMNIVSLPANQKKVISLSFEPITGLAGDYLPLHIVAIFDAANRIDNSTIATAFFQELSQAFPARVFLDSDSDLATCEAFYENAYTVRSLENAKVIELPNERSEMNSDFLFVSFPESSDIETKQLSLNTPTDITLFNPTEETMSYHLFAFVNNTPVMWDSSPYSSITLPAKSQFSSSILLSASPMQNISDDAAPDLFFLVAVPIHEASQQQGTLVLKTKTIAFVT